MTTSEDISTFPLEIVAQMESPSKRSKVENQKEKNIFIFDIDGTLTYHRELEHPHIKELFSYLMAKGARIGFFSAGSIMRNHLLITNLLSQFYGHDGYTDLSNLGQFRIISRDMAVAPNGVHLKKDLSVLLEENETLDDVILIEDRSTFMHPGQDPCILVYESNGCNEYDMSYSDISMKVFAKNTVYYLLGIFKQYFECEEYNQLSLRESIKLILSKDSPIPYDSKRNMPTYPVQMELIHSGLQEVRKKVPEALFYGSVVNDMSRALDSSALFLCDEDFHHTDFEVQSILNSMSSGEKDCSDPHMEVFLAKVCNY